MRNEIVNKQLYFVIQAMANADRAAFLQAVLKAGMIRNHKIQQLKPKT